MKSLRKMIAAVTMALAILSCSPAQRAPNQPVALTIGGPPNISFLAEIANSRGFFREEGLEVTIRPIQTGKLAQDAVIAGQLDYGIVLDVNTAALGFRADNVAVLAVLMSKGDDGLIARRDRGINGPSDLAGKTVARMTGTTSHVYIDRLLERAGVDPATVTFRTMPPPAMQAAVVRGDVDAASLWQPFRLNAAAALGGDGLNLEGSQVYTARVVLIRRAPGAAAAGSQEVRVVRALARAAEFARANPVQAQAIVAPAMGLPPATVASIWGSYSFGVAAPDAARADIERLGAWVSRTQPDFAGRTPDYRAVLGNGQYVRLAAE